LHGIYYTASDLGVLSSRSRGGEKQKRLVPLFVDLGEDLRIPEEGVLLFAELDGVTTELRDENLVTSGNAHGDSLAVAVNGAGTDGKDLGLVLFLDAALGEEDTGGSLGLGLDALDEDTVQEGSEVLDVAEDGLIERRDQG
jgi:hypothetical protein